jgi:hypothetical protein
MPDDDRATMLERTLVGVEPAGETPPPPPPARVVEEDRRPPRIDPARASRLAQMSDYEKAIISVLLTDIIRAGARSPPASGETPWERADKNYWWRWFYAHLCIVQKIGPRRYESRVNGTHTSTSLELWQAQGSAELAAKSLYED